MSRWEPNARERLELAAMELFKLRGYTGTTVEEIASRAGLTERTFFRYFADKREVLFSGSATLQKLMTDAITGAPPGTSPLDAVAAALDASAAALEQRDERYVRARRALVGAHAELLERELIKLASLASAVADALRRRGVTEPAASLTAEAAIGVFKVGFERWLDDKKARGFSWHLRAALDELKTVLGSGNAGAPATSRATTPRPRRSPRAHE
ncbi:MAG TPA: TetR family transcriptional regulator [Polyangiaceae bacterium]|nr:TetR family transcriptional regulator [Polyangiaceae bacterium]